MLETVLSEFPQVANPTSVEPLGNAGGFSGAQLWKVFAEDRLWCVRRWPRSHPSLEHLRWIHRVLESAWRGGCHVIPVPTTTRGNETWLQRSDHLWEVTPWMPGFADLSDDCSSERVSAAFRALANFHETQESCELAVSPGVQIRLQMAANFVRPQRQAELYQAQRDGLSHELFQACQRTIESVLPRLPEVSRLLEPFQRTTFPLQPCIRDIWHQHVLFQDNEVTGIIDFGAMRVESVALDVSRLLSSLQSFAPDLDEVSLSAYQDVRLLSPQEQQLIEFLTQVSPVLSGLNWVCWLLIDRRRFSDEQSVLQRLQQIQWNLDR